MHHDSNLVGGRGSRDDYHCKGAGWYKAQDGTTFPEYHVFIHLQTTTVSSSWAQRVLDMVCYRLVPVLLRSSKSLWLMLQVRVNKVELESLRHAITHPRFDFISAVPCTLMVSSCPGMIQKVKVAVRRKRAPGLRDSPTSIDDQRVHHRSHGVSAMAQRESLALRASQRQSGLGEQS